MNGDYHVEEPKTSLTVVVSLLVLFVIAVIQLTLSSHQQKRIRELEEKIANMGISSR